MLNKLDLLTKENIVTIRDLQKNPSQALKGISRIIRNGKTVGFFFSQVDLEDLMADTEETVSPQFQKKIIAGKKQTARHQGMELADVKKRYGV